MTGKVIRPVLAMLVAASLGKFAFAVDLFNATFEAPDYAAGTLTGQHGWIAFRDANPDAVQVQAAAAHGGAQGVKIDGAAMAEYPTGLFRGYYYPPINYDPTGTGNTLIEYSLDVAFFYTDSTLDVAWQTQFYSSAGDFIGGIGLEDYGDGTNDAYVFNLTGDVVNAAYTLGTWVHMVAQLDYAAGTISLSIDGVSVGSVPFAPAGLDFGDADLTLICDQPFTSFTYVDNYHISASGGATNCPGDLDGDHDVDLQDLATLLAHFGATGPGLPGDIDGDGDVDLQDLATLLAHFGTTCQ